MGTASAVVRALTFVPELLAHFPTDMVWDTQQSRHAVSGACASKVMLLRDLSPTATRILFVDDALEKDRPAGWTLQGARVEAFEGLPYEGPGLDADLMDQIERAILA